MEKLNMIFRRAGTAQEFKDLLVIAAKCWLQNEIGRVVNLNPIWVSVI